MPHIEPGPEPVDEAERLRRLREMLGFSQRELASELGVAHGAVGLWETGKRTVPGPVRRLLTVYEQELGLRQGGAGRFCPLPKSRASRSLKLSGAASAFAARALIARLAEGFEEDHVAGHLAGRLQVAIAQQVVKTMGEAKGVVMKLGQMMGFGDPGGSMAIPARPMSASAVAQVFVEELGQAPRRLFAEWSTQPLAVASIGQVHRARLPDGEEVAVKVQYPGIARAMQVDLGNLAVVQKAVALVLRGMDSAPLVEELRARLLEECDYRQEAANQERFRRLWAGNPGIAIPRVFPELSTRRILVTELARGQSLAAFSRQASLADRKRAGETLFAFAMESMFRHGIFNADPHPGNFLFDGGTVTCLDFGCVKQVPASEVEQWKALARAILERDLPGLASLGLRAGLIRDPARFDLAAQHQLTLKLYQPFCGAEPYQFTRKWLADTWRAVWLGNRNRFQTAMPRHWLFLPRLQWGLYAILADLGIHADWRGKLLDLVYPPGAPRPPPYSAAEMRLAAGLSE